MATATGTTSSIAAPNGPPSTAASSGGDQEQLLRDVAARTWAFLSGPDLDPTTHLPRNNVGADGNGGGTFTSPTEIGLYLSAVVAARDLGLTTPAQALAMMSDELSTIEKLQKDHGFLLRWYSTLDGTAIQGPSGRPATEVVISSVDNGWLAQGLLIAGQAFPELSSRFDALLGAMDWTVLFDSGKGLLYDSYTEGVGPSRATYDLAYGGPRIADYMALGSHRVPGSLWWTLNRTPPSASQRQVPEGTSVTYPDPDTGRGYAVFEGHYTYDGVQFVPTFGGSMFQALAPDLIVGENNLGPRSVGVNDRNTVLAQIAYAQSSLHYPVWGLAPATDPEHSDRYAQYGAAGLATKVEPIPEGAVTPYASFLALDALPSAAYRNIVALMHLYPSLYTRYGFLDSVDPTNGAVAGRYMAVSQSVILMALDNALEGHRLQSYFDSSSYGQRLAQYLSIETFSVTAADVSGTG